MKFINPADERADQEDTQDRMMKQITEWEDQDRYVDPKSDQYEVTFNMGTRDQKIVYRARNDFQAVRSAMEWFNDMEPWERVYTESMTLYALDEDGKRLEKALLVLNN